MAETTLRDTLRLAEDDIGAGRPADALTRCQHILKHYPEMLEARRVLGEAYLALGKTKEAFQAFDRVLVSDPENTLAYCGRALISQQLGDYDAALDCYYQACELSLGNRQLRLEFRRLASQANQPDFVLSRVGLARLYMRGDLLAHAIREWEQILQGDPQRIDAHIGLAEALWRDGQTKKAAERCRIILEAVPSCLKAQLLLGEIAYRAGQLDDARRHLEQARRQDPDGRMARELFADALIHDKAWADFLLTDPARIPVMAMDSSEHAQQATIISQPLTPPLDRSPAADTDMTQHENGTHSDPGFSFPFLGTGTPASGPPLYEGESLEEMLAALIERPAQAEHTPAPAPSSEQATIPQHTDPFQALLQSFSQPRQQKTTLPLSGSVTDQAAQEQTTSPSPLVDAESFSEALFWLDATNRQSTPGQPPGSERPASHSKTAAAEPPPQRGEEPLPLLRPANQELWAEEEDTEAGWLRWLQAQGARPLDAANDQGDLTGPFAALLSGTDQPQKPPTRLWESPDPEFVRSFWPTDTVPQPTVRITPGTSTRPLGSTGDTEKTSRQGDVTALAGISSVSLRPLTLQELEQTFSASGLTPLESTLTALTDWKSTSSWEERPVLTIAENDYPARLELAERQRKSGRLDEALGHYRAIIRGAPELIEQVIEGLKQIAADNPEHAAVYRLLGDAYTRCGAYMEALEAYNRGLAASRGQ